MSEDKTIQARQFIHIRFVDREGAACSNGGVTVLYDPRLTTTYGPIMSGVVCSLKDHYCKRVGRVKASGRILSKNSDDAQFLMSMTFSPKSLKEVVEAAHSFAIHLINKHYPQQSIDKVMCLANLGITLQPFPLPEKN